MALAGEMLALGDLAPERRRRPGAAEAALDDGRAAEKFARMVVGAGRAGRFPRASAARYLAHAPVIKPCTRRAAGPRRRHECARGRHRGGGAGRRPHPCRRRDRSLGRPHRDHRCRHAGPHRQPAVPRPCRERRRCRRRRSTILRRAIRIGEPRAGRTAGRHRPDRANERSTSPPMSATASWCCRTSCRRPIAMPCRRAPPSLWRPSIRARRARSSRRATRAMRATATSWSWAAPSASSSRRRRPTSRCRSR